MYHITHTFGARAERLLSSRLSLTYTALLTLGYGTLFASSAALISAHAGDSLPSRCSHYQGHLPPKRVLATRRTPATDPHSGTRGSLCPPAGPCQPKRASGFAASASIWTDFRVIVLDRQERLGQSANDPRWAAADFRVIVLDRQERLGQSANDPRWAARSLGIAQAVTTCRLATDQRAGPGRAGPGRAAVGQQGQFLRSKLSPEGTSFWGLINRRAQCQNASLMSAICSSPLAQQQGMAAPLLLVKRRTRNSESVACGTLSSLSKAHRCIIRQ